MPRYTVRLLTPPFAGSRSRKIIGHMELTSGRFELNAGNIQPKEPIWTSQNSKTRHGPYDF